MSDTDIGSGWERRRRVLLGEYERIALERFAADGFRSVTVDDIADAAGVSARTLFRYFPTKEDFLLGFPRRGVAATTEALAELDPSETPLLAAWQMIRELFIASPTDVELLNLWRRAAEQAPEVVARLRGERTQALHDAVASYCVRSLDGSVAADLRAHVLGGIIAGVEFAVVEAWGRSDLPLPAILDEAERSIRDLDAAGPGAR
jgi:TetR/AcrR family transcriptional regulator, regulator of mycofactocin system